MIVTAADGVPSISVAEFPDLTSDELQALLRSTDAAGQASGWLVDYDRQQTAPKAWLAAIGGIGPKLWTLFAGKLDAALKQAGVKHGARLIVLPTGALGLLPLELARDPAGGRSFADAYNVTADPEPRSLSRRRPRRRQGGAPSLAEAVNPTGDDPEAEPAVHRGRGRDCGLPLQGQAAGQAGPVQRDARGGAGRAQGQKLLALRLPRPVRLGRRPPVRPPDEGQAAPHRGRAARCAGHAREPAARGAVGLRDRALRYDPGTPTSSWACPPRSWSWALAA